MKYIEKEITDRANHKNLVWVATELNINLYNANPRLGESEQSAVIILKGYADKQSLIDKKEPADTKSVYVENISDLDCYPVVLSEVVPLILANEEFVDGILKDTEDSV